jgi:predicted Fe-S protein YdhL (DUF1289 family)
MNNNTTISIEPAEHANNTNPCQGICISDNNDICIGCFRTADERSTWYEETNEWREQVLIKIKEREEKYV